MSCPREDWGLRGRANVFAEHAVSPAAHDAQRDWHAVKDAIVAAGGDVVVVDSNDAALTGLPYTAEAGVVGRDEHGPVFVLPNLTPPHRQREPDVIGPALEQRGLRLVRIDGAFEGQGDVINVGGSVEDGEARFVCTAGVGRWARTAATAFAQLQPLLPGPSMALSFRADPWFHGNTFLGSYRKTDFKSPSTDAVIVVCSAALEANDFLRLDRFTEHARIVDLTKEETLTYATNALQVNDTVIAPAGVPPRVVDAWRSLDLDVRFLELPALFGRGGGAAVCLTNRLWGLRRLDDDDRLVAVDR